MTVSLTPYSLKKQDLKLKLLIYGAPGVGKTTFGSSAAVTGKTLFLDVEGGMLSIPNEYAKNIKVMDLRSTEQLETLLWVLSHPDEKANPWLKGLQTVVLDSGSEFANISLESIVAKQVERNTKRDSLDDVWLADYGKLTASLLRLFRHLRDIPYNVIMTALSNSVYPNSDKGTQLSDPLEVKPAFTKKLGESVMGYFDCVWYMYTKPGDEGHNASILTQPRGVYRAKTRGTGFPQSLGETLHNPTFEQVLKALRNSEK